MDGIGKKPQSISGTSAFSSLLDLPILDKLFYFHTMH